MAALRGIAGFLVLLALALQGGPIAFSLEDPVSTVKYTLNYVVEFDTLRATIIREGAVASVSSGRALVTVEVIVGQPTLVVFNVSLVTGNGSTVFLGAHRLVLGAFNEVFREDGKWAGAFPYIAYIDLERPTLEVLGLRLQGGGHCPILKESNVEYIERVAEALGSPVRYKLAGFGEKVVVRGASGYSITEGPGVLFNCEDFSLYPLFLDPSAPSPGYSQGNLSFSPSETIIALPLSEAEFIGPGDVWASGEGIALVELEGSREQRFFMLALHPSILPDFSSLKYTPTGRPPSLPLLLNETLFLKAYPEVMEGSRALYHVETGFLLEANITTGFVVDALKAFVDPILVDHGGHWVDFNSTWVHARLVGFEGGPGPLEV
ncbi:MAG: hypothetical protein LRS43_02835, partial [Desulfurococcales archaeon]|nr:hypothetical protein [Desulfurococcales archaeon]